MSKLTCPTCGSVGVLTVAAAPRNRDPAVVAAVQEALMKHPFWKPGLGSSGFAFGLANTAIDAYLAVLSPDQPAATPPRQPTEAMLNAARDWSRKKYGTPIGNDGAVGCWQAMLAASPCFDISEEQRHAIGHARYLADQATPEKPDCCFDYELVRALLSVIDRYSVTRPTLCGGDK
jgi:hypothetical protein